MQQPANCIHTQKENFAHFKWEKNLRIKIITIGGVEKILLLLMAWHSVERTSRSIFDVCRKKRGKNKWQQEKKPLPFNVLIATCILLNQMRPFFALRYESGLPDIQNLSKISKRYQARKQQKLQISIMQTKKQFVDETNRKADLNS